MNYIIKRSLCALWLLHRHNWRRFSILVYGDENVCEIYSIFQLYTFSYFLVVVFLIGGKAAHAPRPPHPILFLIIVFPPCSDAVVSLWKDERMQQFVPEPGVDRTLICSLLHLGVNCQCLIHKTTTNISSGICCFHFEFDFNYYQRWKCENYRATYRRLSARCQFHSGTLVEPYTRLWFKSIKFPSVSRREGKTVFWVRKSSTKYSRTNENFCCVVYIINSQLGEREKSAEGKEVPITVSPVSSLCGLVFIRIRTVGLLYKCVSVELVNSPVSPPYLIAHRHHMSISFLLNNFSSWSSFFGVSFSFADKLL